MARNNRRSFKKTYSSNKSNTKSPVTTTSQPQPQQQPQPQSQPQSQSFLGNMAQGASFGMGMGLGSELIHGLFGGNKDNDKTQTEIENQTINNKCSFEVQQFQECINNNSVSLSDCQLFYNSLQECSTKFNLNVNNKVV